MLAYHASTCKFQNIRFSIAENSTSLPLLFPGSSYQEFTQLSWILPTPPRIYIRLCKHRERVQRKTSRDTSIPLVEEVELLGVTVNDKLKFESQIKTICRKMSQQIAVLKRMKKLLPLKLWEKLYRAFIAPHFTLLCWILAFL